MFTTKIYLVIPPNGNLVNLETYQSLVKFVYYEQK